MKLSLLPFHLSSSLTNSLLPFPSLHHFLPHLFLPSHFPLAIFSFLLPLLPSLSSSQPVSGVFSHNFSLLYFFYPLRFSQAFGESRGRKQLGSQTMEHIKIKKQHQPHQLLTHTQAEQDKQDIPAAGCTGFLALANLKRRMRLGVEQSREAG